jgi:uncharacterized paraquat-inducible protein A
MSFGTRRFTRRVECGAVIAWHAKALVVVARTWYEIVMGATRAQSLGLVACRMCGQTLARPVSVPARCTRCRSIVTKRLEHSEEKTLAWLLTGMALYFPANLMPVMHTSSVRGGGDSTIIE